MIQFLETKENTQKQNKYYCLSNVSNGKIKFKINCWLLTSFQTGPSTN